MSSHWLICIVVFMVIGPNAFGKPTSATRAPALSSSLTSWIEYGGPSGIDESGHFSMAQHYSKAQAISKENVSKVVQLAEFEWQQDVPESYKNKLQANSVTPIHVSIGGEDFLFGCSAFNQVFKLRGRNEANGKGKILDLLATFNPELQKETDGENYKCRGVTYWEDPSKDAAAACHHKIFQATMDGRLFALDAKSLALCGDFGNSGVIDLRQDLRTTTTPDKLEYYVATAPLIYPVKNGGGARPHAMLVLGGGVRDSLSLKVASGAVRGYDASTGRRIWVWDPIRKNGVDGRGELTQGTPNAWVALAMDPVLGHVYLPMGNASPDYHHASRKPGIDHYSSSVVALDMASIDFSKKNVRPKVAWHKKLVERDVWDFDVPAQPLLTTIDGTPALVQATKMGFVFFINRKTGEWLKGHKPEMINIEDRAHRNRDKSAPSIATPDEILAKAQPFPPQEWRLHADMKNIDEATWEHPSCQTQKKDFYFNGIFTPTTADKQMRGSLHFPGAGGGMEWGGLSFDPARRLLYVNQSHWGYYAKLLLREDYDKEAGTDPKGNGKSGYRPMHGSKYGTYRSVFLVQGSKIKAPMFCTKPPWGSLIAINIDTGKIQWGVEANGQYKPFGKFRRMASLMMDNTPEDKVFEGDEFLSRLFKDPEFDTGTTNIGGSVITSAGLLFIGATGDGIFRAIDADTGKTLKEFAIPEGIAAMANPMTYIAGDGKQYVVVAAGGNPFAPGKRGKKILAYGLK